jgi:hypothetical protein
MIMWFFGIGGLAIYGWQFNVSFVNVLRDRMGALQQTSLKVVGGLPSDLGPRGSPLEGIRKTTREDEPAPLIRKVNPTSASDFLSMAQPKESGKPDQVPEKTKLSERGSISSMAGEGNGGEGSATSVSHIASWRKKPIAVQPGSTIAEIATNVYGTQRNLGIDLIKEYNTHIENLNRIQAGQRLWLPPLSRETLVRQQADGSYNLILASFRNPLQSEQLAQAVRLKGYDVVVTPRRVSHNLTLHRVEINTLESVGAVNRAWEIASTNQWIAFAENRPGKRF